jgi:hypothetical protein
MKIPKMLFIAGIVLVVIGCTSDRPWIGTYALEITEESKEMYDMFLEMGMVWPEITLNEDGTFVTHKTEGGVKISGTYTVEGSTLTIYAQEVGGKEPEGKYAEPHKAPFEDNFQVLMMEGPDRERWVRKEANTAFLKGE